MLYAVLVLPSAERDLARIQKAHMTRILAKIESLAGQPRPVGAQKLRGTDDRYRIRQGRYRMLYRVDERFKRVFVYAVGDGKDVYR